MTTDTHVLLGQYDSPFVRRAAMALTHHGVAFRREVLSVFGDFDEVLARNPLGKVPALRLPSGEWLFESRAIVEWVETTAPPERRLTPVEPGALLAVLRLEAVALGLAEKVYERGIETARRAPGTQDASVIARTERQVASALGWLEETIAEPFAAGARLTRADLAATCALTYLAMKQPQLWDAGRHPRLDSLRRRCEALEPFAVAPFSADEARRA